MAMKAKANPGPSLPGSREKVGPGHPPKEHQFKPGVSGNPAGSAKGKRISTWMLELLNTPESEWPKGKNVMPGAKIAMARIKRSQTRAFGEASTNILLDRTEGSVQKTADVAGTIGGKKVKFKITGL